MVNMSSTDSPTTGVDSTDADNQAHQITTIKVDNPTLINIEGERPHTKYLIHVETNSEVFNKECSKVWRRFSEFVELRNTLEEHNPTKKLPKLPTRGFFQDRMDQTFVTERAAALQVYLQELISIPCILSETVFHLFMQSHLSMREVSEAMSLHLSPTDIILYGDILEPTQ